MSSPSYFHVFISGQIESAIFPLGPDASEIFCRFEIFAGADWDLVSGLKFGITQSASNSGGNFNDEIVFNMPLEMTYKSTNLYGWPQIIICVYGKTRWGIETSLGYCRVHVPLLKQDGHIEVNTPILIPQSNSLISDITNWITGRNAELRDPKTLLDRLLTETYGEIKLKLNVLSRGLKKLGYDWS